jgi:SAM-dependent methyltransferase
MINFIKRLLNSFRKTEFIEDSGSYWEKRYKDGGNSGVGSYDKFAIFKAEFLNEFVLERNVESVIELGCGDGNNLRYFNFKNYIGYDISSTAINFCNEIFKGDKDKHFALFRENIKERAELSMSLDVIYHLIEDEVFENYMNNLFNTSQKFVIIYSSNSLKYNSGTAPHVKHRIFTNWVQNSRTEFKLIEKIENKYPFRGNNRKGSFADFYIYEREE